MRIPLKEGVRGGERQGEDKVKRGWLYTDILLLTDSCTDFKFCCWTQECVSWGERERERERERDLTYIFHNLIT